MTEKQPLFQLYMTFKTGEFASLNDLTGVNVDDTLLSAYRKIEGRPATTYGYPLENILGFEIIDQPTMH